MGFATPIRAYLDTLVHPSAQNDALTMARHRAFIAPRLLGGSVALAAMPIYLAARGIPSALEVAVFAWLLAPILIAYFLSRTGRYESAHMLSSLALTVLVTVVAARTGGIESFAAIWLVVVPLEAALSASRRVVATASTLALCAAGLLMFGTTGGGFTDFGGAGHSAFAMFGIVSATLFATGLALGAESLARTGFWLLYAEEDRYRLLARNMTDVITRHDRNGVVLFVSPAAEQLFGVVVDDLLEYGLFDRVHVADRPAYLTALADAAARGVSRSVEFRVRCGDADGAADNVVRFLWIEMRCRALEQAVDAPEVVAVMRDVTQRKQQEQALLEARTEAERADAAKGRFLATMSHELRTPLNVIIGFSEMLQNEADLNLAPAQRVDYAKLINDSGQHLLSVVNGILDMSKIDTGDFDIRPEAFAVAPVIKNCCDLLALKAHEAGLAVVLDCPEHLTEIVADKRALKQILINLLSNAIKFTDRGGKIAVSAGLQGATLRISVADNGIGIAADDLQRVGAPFFQARGSYDRRHDGTGLGLSIVKGLVDLHGGEVTIASRPGEGTCVSITLPLDCERSRPENAVVRPLIIESKAEVRQLNIAVKKSA